MPTLRIVSVNDVYSLENLPRLRTLIEAERKKPGADVVLATLPGDFIAPSLLSSLDHGRAMVECLDAVGIDLVTFGNHEDDVAPEELLARTRELNARWLATNVHGFSPALPKSHVLEVGGARVGFVGVVVHEPTLYRGKPFGGAQVEPANATALAEARRLVRDEGCAFVIPLTHQLMADDRLLARDGNPPFPVILGGHEHEAMIEQVGPTWIVKAGSEATRAVVIDVTWDEAVARVRVPEAVVRIENVSDHAEDPALRARVDRHMERVREIERAVLVSLAPGEELSSVGTRFRQTSLGTLVCTRIRDAMGAEGCLFNGGGIRASRVYRDRFTYADVKAEMPFDNEIVVARLPGHVVRDAVAASRARAPVESGGFLQVDDRMRVEGGVVTSVDGQPIDPERVYRMALVRNLLAGLDGIEPLIRFARECPAEVPPADTGREIKIVLVDAFSLALWHQLGGFDAVDANHDGVVTVGEVAVALAHATHEAPSDVTAGLVVRALDTNEDHAISRAEAEAADPGDTP